jgi:hypothetical protein
MTTGKRARPGARQLGEGRGVPRGQVSRHTASVVVRRTFPSVDRRTSRSPGDAAPTRRAPGS